METYEEHRRRMNELWREPLPVRVYGWTATATTAARYVAAVLALIWIGAASAYLVRALLGH